MNKRYAYVAMLLVVVILPVLDASSPVSNISNNTKYTIHPLSLSVSPNLNKIWQFAPSNAISNVNYTATGNIFGNGKMGFISWYKSSSDTCIFTGISYNGVPVWNISITNYVNFTMYGQVLNYYQTILIQSGSTLGPGIATFALYNAYNGSMVWMHNITLSSGQSILSMPTGISTNNGNATLLFLSTNKTSVFGNNIKIFSNDVLLLYPYNGTVQQILSYTTYGVTALQNIRFIYILPSFPGLSDGGFIVDQFLPYISSNGTIIHDYMLSYTLDGRKLFNITAPSSNESTISLITSVSAGNYLGGADYYIALTTMNIFINNNNINSEYGTIALVNVNGTLKYTLIYPNNTYPISVQSFSNNYFKSNYRLQPSTPIGNLIDYTGTNSNPDILLEAISIPSNEAYLSVLNVATNTFLWNSTINFNSNSEIVEPLTYSFNSISIPNILLISQSGNITSLYGSNGTVMWKIVQNGYLSNIAYNTLAQCYPSLMNITQPNITSFITLSYTTTNPTNTDVKLNVYSAINGKIIYSKVIYLTSLPQYSYIFPIGECYNTTTMNIGAIFISEYANQKVYYFYGLAGNNGSYIFNGSGTFSSLRYSISFQSGYVFGLFYSGLNNGQVTSDSKIDDLFVSTGTDIIAYDVNQYSIMNSSKLFNVYLTANITSGYIPLNVTFTVNVTGNSGPYKYVWNIDNLSLFTDVSYLNYTFAQKGIFPVYVNVTDKLGESIKSNVVNITANPKNVNNKIMYYNITGYITNENNIPIQNVLVNTSDGNRTITNAEGMFYVYLPNGTWHITAYKSGYYTYIENITVNGSGQSIFITLKPYTYANSNNNNSSSKSNIGVVITVFLLAILIIALLYGVLIIIKVFKK
ncbi:MAG: carboxypeptidase regulatory-like domain-containing protein [Thermoplasmata archaeon]